MRQLVIRRAVCGVSWGVSDWQEEEEELPLGEEKREEEEKGIRIQSLECLDSVFAQRQNRVL